VIPATALFGLAIGQSMVFLFQFKLAPFIVTWQPGKSSPLDACHYQRISDPPIGTGFTVYGQGAFLGVPGPAAFLSCRRRPCGCLEAHGLGNLYAIGGNRDAAVLVGIPGAWQQLLVYALAGMFAALAGIMYLSR
jgi:ribose transport system permease protein